jgi:heat shock protein HslJ
MAEPRPLPRRLALVAVLPLALAAAGCGDDSTAQTIPQSGVRESTTTTSVATTTTAPALAVSGEWIIEDLTTSGTARQAPAGAELTFQGGRVDVATGCNHGSGPAEVGGSTVTFGELSLTATACDESTMAWESSLLGFLTGEATFVVNEDTLLLTRGADQLRLISV